jgi:tetratricopeptide (TPR) repeat protein
MPRWRFDVDDANSELLRMALELEVARIADKPVEALDVRDLAFRAYMYWGTHRGLEPKKAYDVATDLLTRALAVAPDDRLALYLTARVNLCDCVMAWSQDIEAQKKIGTAALDKYLRIDPWSATALMEKAEIFQLRGRIEEMMSVLEQVLARDPENPVASLGKALGLFRLGRPAEALALIEPIRDRELYFHANVLALDAAARYALADYETAARLAREAASQMNEDELRQSVDGPVRLLLAAAEAKLGHLDRAAAVMTEFRSSVPQATTITALRSWIYPTSELYGFEPLFDGLRLAGVKD